MQIFDDFDFTKNDLKTHAFNLTKIAKWYFSPVQEGENEPNYRIGINTCLNILSVAHGFNNYKSLKTAIADGKRFEPLQSNDTYFNRLIDSNYIKLLKLTEIQAGLKESNINHFFDTVASYIRQTGMELNKLNEPSCLKNVQLHADVSILKYFNIYDRSFLKIALLNHIIVSAENLKFPCETIVCEELISFIYASKFHLRCNLTHKNIQFTLNRIENIDVLKDNSRRILFDIKLVNQLNTFLYGEGQAISEILNPLNFKIDFPHKLPDAEKIYCSDLIKLCCESEFTQSIHEHKTPPKTLISDSEIFEKFVKPTDFGCLTYLSLEIMFTNPNINSLYKNLKSISDDNTLNFTEYAPICFEFEKSVNFHGREAKLIISIDFYALITYSITANYKFAKFTIQDVQSSESDSSVMKVFLYSGNNWDSDYISIDFDRSFYQSKNLPYKEYIIRYLNQKLNQSKYEILSLHNAVSEFVEDSL